MLLHLGVSVLLVSLVAFSFSEAAIIPENFVYRDLSQYTVRYLSEAGSDTNSCLKNQDYPVTVNSTIEYCRTFQFALTGSYNFSTEYINRLIVLVQSGSYTFGPTGTKIYHSNHVILSRLPGEGGEVVLTCSSLDEFNYNNLYYYNSSYIALNDVVLSRCGQQSTALATLSVRRLVVANTTFRDNLNSGVLAHESEDMLIVDSSFQDNNSTAFYNNTNTFDPGGFRLAGGLVISWNSSSDESTTVIRNCTFINNHAGINRLNSDDARPNIYQPRGHGGAIVVSFEKTRNHTLMIEGSRLFNNTALFNGGGVFISVYSDSIGNDIIITDSTFEDNTCVHTGGAISMNIFEVANENILTVKNTSFERNSAWVGGGAYSLTLQDNLVPEEAVLVVNTASFSNCTFTNNSSPTGGSAISLVSNLRVDQVVATSNFSDCTFSGNKASNQSAVLSFRFPISLHGTTIFRGNKGGAVTLLQSRIDISGSAVFEDNSARVGGALILEDQSLIHLLEGSEVSFIRNYAEIQGGAISVRAPTVGLDTDIIRLFNTRCFIQYEFSKVPASVDPAEWKTSMSFINNTAEIDGAAIYATSINLCVYTPSFEKLNSSTVFEESIFQLPHQFTFSGNQVLNPNARRTTEIVATAPFKLLIEPESFLGAPGERIDLKLGALDQGGNWQAAVWSLAESYDYRENIPADEENQVKRFFALPAGGSNHSYEIAALDVNQYGNCSTGFERSLNLSLVQVIAGDIVSVSTVKVNLTCCYPGYSLSAQGICVHNHDNQHIVRPDRKLHYIYVEPDIYAEVRDGELVTAIMPTPFQNCIREGTLPGCLFKFDHPEEQCSQRRTGFLCGKCPDGEGVDLTLRQCKKCAIGDAIAVAVIVIAFFVASILVLFYNVGIPNELKGCLFFIQVVGFVYESTNGVGWDFHLSRVFGFSFYLPLCPYPGYSALGTAAYGLLLSFLAIATLVVYIISARFSRVLSHRNSFEGIWLLSIITYKYTADTCFNLLRCQKVSGKDITGEFVYYYDGSVQCFHSGHLAVSIVALLLGIVVVLLFPVLIFVISFRTFKHTQPFTDVLTKGIKVSCRWWSGFDLFRRLLFIIVVFFFSYVQPGYTQIALLITGLFIFTVFACSKPYDGKWSNIIEALVLSDLLALTILFLDTDPQSRADVHPLALLLLLLPFLSIAFYITAAVVVSIWKKVAPTSFMQFCKKFQSVLHRQMATSKVRKSVSHSLEMTSIEQNLIENTEEDDASKSQLEYTVYREELLDDT